MDRAFLKVYAVQFIFSTSHVFGWTLSSLYFFKIGYTFMDIALYYALSFITAVFVIAVISQFRPDRWILLGLVLKILLFAAVAYSYIKPLIFLVGIIQGLMVVFYGVPMNITFFRFRREGKNASHSGTFFAMWPLLNAILPAFAGIVAEMYGMFFVFFLAGAILLPAIAISSRLKESDLISSDFKSFVKNTKGLKSIVFLQGIWEGIEWVAVPLATLAFVLDEVKFGAFYSYLGFFGIVAFFALGKMSDRLKKRAIFLYPVTLAMAVFTILSGFASSFFEWGLYRGAISFLVSIFSPFSMTLIVDLTRNMGDSMISRGFFLNFGRALGASIVALMLAMSIDVRYTLVVAGAILLLHPLFLRKKKRGYPISV